MKMLDFRYLVNKSGSSCKYYCLGILAVDEYQKRFILKTCWGKMDPATFMAKSCADKEYEYTDYSTVANQLVNISENKLKKGYSVVAYSFHQAKVGGFLSNELDAYLVKDTQFDTAIEDSLLKMLGELK